MAQQILNLIIAEIPKLNELQAKEVAEALWEHVQRENMEHIFEDMRPSDYDELADNLSAAEERINILRERYDDLKSLIKRVEAKKKDVETLQQEIAKHIEDEKKKED